MTYVSTPPKIDNAKLTAVARNLLINADDPTNTKLFKAFNILTEDGAVHQLSFNELEGLINIMDLQRPIDAKIDPTGWLIMTYSLDDLESLLAEGWRVTEYVLTLDAAKRTMSFTGTINHIHCIVGHPSYDPLVKRAPKVFEYLLGDFELLQQTALTRVMAGIDPSFGQVAGTFDVSYTFTWGRDGIKFETAGVEE